jgi:hypothetical protein
MRRQGIFSEGSVKADERRSLISIAARLDTLASRVGDQGECKEMRRASRILLTLIHPNFVPERIVDEDALSDDVMRD